MATFPGFNSSNVKEIFDQSIRFWDEAGQAHDNFYLSTNDREQMAHAKIPDKIKGLFEAHKDRSCLAPADFFVNIASLRAAVHNLIFRKKPYGIISYFGQPNRLDPVIQKAEAVLQNMNDLAMVEQTSDDAIHQALYAGRSATIMSWTKKKVRMPQRYEDGEIKVDSDDNPIYGEEVVARYAEAIPIDIRRVRIDPSISNISQRRIVGHHGLASLYDLLKKNQDPKSFYQFDRSELEKSAFDTSKFYEYVHGEADVLGRNPEPNEGFGDRIVEVKYLRGLFRVTRGTTVNLEDLIVHIANSDIVLGVKPNNLPINGWEMYDFPAVDSELDRVFPMGVIEAATDMWLYLFLVMNHIIDRNNREIYDMFFADKAAVQDLPEYIPHEQGKIVGLDLMASGAARISDAVQQYVKQPQSNTSFNLASMMSNIIQQMMRLSDYVQGSDPGKTETATGVTALVQGGLSLLTHLTNKLKYTFFQPVWQKELILWNFFQGRNENIIYGSNGEPINIRPNEINALWQIDIDVNSNSDRPDMIRRFIESMPMLKNDPNIDQYALSKTSVEILQLPNGDRLLVNNEALMQAINKENVALAQGVPQPVHQSENHTAHIEGHAELQGEGLIDQHIQEHQQFIEQQNEGQLGNTKDLGGGQVASPALAAQTHRVGQGTGLKAEARG